MIETNRFHILRLSKTRKSKCHSQPNYSGLLNPLIHQSEWPTMAKAVSESLYSESRYLEVFIWLRRSSTFKSNIHAQNDVQKQFYLPPYFLKFEKNKDIILYLVPRGGLHQYFDRDVQHTVKKIDPIVSIALSRWELKDVRTLEQ